MSCQPAARTPKPLSHRLKQDSRAVKPLHTLRHTTPKKKNAVEAQMCAEGKADLMSVFGIVV